MPPILTVPTGIAPQTQENGALRKLLEDMRALSPEDVPAMIEPLVRLLEPYKDGWRFEEQVDLNEWTHPLNVMDAAFHWVLLNHSAQLLLVAPPKPDFEKLEHRRRRLRQGCPAGESMTFPPLTAYYGATAPLPAARSLQDLEALPAHVLRALKVLLQFTSVLLRNAVCKSVYQTVPYLTDLLAAADDTIADAALAALQALAAPPLMHKQQAPEQQVHSTLLHLSVASSSSSSSVTQSQSVGIPPMSGTAAGALMDASDHHARLTALARGWGTHATGGLGLLTAVTADDSIHGQGSLPGTAGEVNFGFRPFDETRGSDAAMFDQPLRMITLTEEDMLKESGGDTAMMVVRDRAGADETDMAATEACDDNEILASSSSSGSKKRRRVISKREVKSTAELFFLALERAGDAVVPPDLCFSLLADIRLARGVYTQGHRVQAVQRRLRALCCILQVHPSQEVMTGFFQAHPELWVEIIDLLRPTVSAANVSATSSVTRTNKGSAQPAVLMQQDAIAGLAGQGGSSVSTSSPHIDFSVRMLALESLTALIARRDTVNGAAFSGHPKLSSVLTELGVGKGQYLGFLPTLIRYSLAWLGSMQATGSAGTASSREEPPTSVADSSPLSSLDVGLAFVEATVAPPLPRAIQLERALEFVDSVLTLTSAVVGTPNGTSALVDCGLVPALLATAAMDPQTVVECLLPSASGDTESELRRSRILALLRFVTGQAIQILEGVVVTHSHAMTAFHDLHGIETLTKRLHRETMQSNPDKDVDGDVTMHDAGKDEEPRICSSQRVLIISILTCLTVVFHQDSTASSSNTTAPSSGAQLRKKELTEALKTMLNNVVSYGGHLASLIATLLSDVMNSDPHVVNYVHSSGIAESFLNMILGKTTTDPNGKVEFVPVVPAVPELIMGIPSVLSALALTEDGAEAVKKVNPFPPLLKLFYHPSFAMPQSRCLLNELTAIVGTGLDEMMRHVERLKPQILEAIANAINEMVLLADDLRARERKETAASVNDASLETERTCLIQYVLNFGQLLEQILHNEDHCEPFAEAGGLDALLKIFPSTLPSGVAFLSHLSCQSSPSVSTLHHSTIEESISLAFKCIQYRHDQKKLLNKIAEAAIQHLDSLEQRSRVLFGTTELYSVLDRIPTEPLYKIAQSGSKQLLENICDFVRDVAVVQWISTILATAIKVACQRSHESGTGWSRTEREWKKEVSSETFVRLLDRMTSFFESSLFEVCRVRSSSDFERLEAARLEGRSRNVYRLRVVCPEGAVVRDGIDIDSCANVGSMEMGEIVESFDRCINSSGILRYRTRRGWVSEMTRGHARESIAEVIRVWEWENKDSEDVVGEEAPQEESQNERRIEAGVLDARSAIVAVLARGQTAHSELVSSLSRLVVQGARSVPTRTLSFEEDTQAKHVRDMLQLLAGSLKRAMSQSDVVACVRACLATTGAEPVAGAISPAGAAMYLGCILSIMQACLFEDRRERKIVNFLLLVSLVATDSFVERQDIVDVLLEKEAESLGLFDCVRFVFCHALSDFEKRSKSTDMVGTTGRKHPRQVVGRSVAASFSPTVKVLRRILTTQLSLSPAATIMSRMHWKDVSLLVGADDILKSVAGSAEADAFFQPEVFVHGLQVCISMIIKETWLDARAVHAPPFLIHPFTSLVGEVMVALEDSSKKKSNAPEPDQGRPNERLLLSELMRRRQDEASDAANEAEFEASEEAITQLMEMGFSRDHALDALESTRSSRIEVAMDYALSNPPPSRATIERRRAEREQRAQRRAEQRRQQEEAAAAAAPVGAETSAGNDSRSGDRVAADAENQADSTGAEGEVGGGNTAEASSSEAEERGTRDSSEAATATTTMEVDSATSSGEEKKDSIKDKVLAKTKAELHTWIENVPRICCSLLGGMKASRKLPTTDTVTAEARREIEEGDGDLEAATVVISSFLLDVCHRYPARRSEIASLVMKELKTKLSNSTAQDSEASISALCHAAVLFTRALPKTRTLVLNVGVVHALVSRVETWTNSRQSTDSSVSVFPLWIAPAFLLLDIMAQPVVAFSASDKTDDADDPELAQVRKEHHSQSIALSETADKIFTSVTRSSGGNDPEKSKDAKNIAAQTTESSMDVDEKPDDKKESKSPFSSVPAYFPLLPLDCAPRCLELCIRLLKRGDELDEGDLPPGAAHGVLMLLLRLLRSPKVSSRCLQCGVADAILGLPKYSKFTGNTGLITLIFRRLLEDEVALQAAMETEIRSAVSKLFAKKKSGARDETPFAPLSGFVEAVTPLLCRDPMSFFKAMALSVTVVPVEKTSKDMKVVLITPKERSRHAEALADVFKGSFGTNSVAKPDGRRESFTRGKKTSSPAKGKAKSQQKQTSRRSSLSKKNRREKSDGAKASSSNAETPAAQLTSLLVSAILTSAEQNKDYDKDDSFLWLGNLLEILADLVLAVPACASSLHNLRSNKLKEKTKKQLSSLHTHHALVGCPDPSKSFVSFLLHSLLPQDRWTIRNNRRIWDRRKEDSEGSDLVAQKWKAFRTLVVSQTSARVLVALVARPGEGRKRVMTELVFALSGGILGYGPPSISTPEDSNRRTSRFVSGADINALHAWGELCLGLMAPRSNGKNLEGMASLSVENLRLMLEYGMAHALLLALNLVKIEHPMASLACGALLQPLELITRASVSDAVKDCIQKESKSSEGAEASKVDSSDKGRGYHDSPDSWIRGESGSGVDAGGFNMLVENEGHDMINDEVQQDVEMDEDIDDEGSDEDDDEEEDDEELASSEDSDVMDEDDDEADDSESDDEDEDDQIDDGVDASAGWGIDYGDTLVAENPVAEQPFYGYEDMEEQEEEGTERIDPEDLNDGWTRIESTGFGGMLLGGRRGGDNSARANRGLIDAAEHMIGAILRNGDMSGDALAEIEGSLGIRIMAGGRSLRTTLRPGDGLSNFGESLANRLFGGDAGDRNRGSVVVGTLPHVNQRTQPDVGYSAFGRNGNAVDVSSMEFVFGGPAVTAGSRNYDLVSPVLNENEFSSSPNLTQHDLQLFPGGPALAASSRTQHALHPLLCGVDLPPVNALVSDLLPHGVRATRRGQMTTRRPGDWTTGTSLSAGSYLVSTSNGNIIRSNRTSSGTMMGLSTVARNVAGPVGWTDDGLPVDATVQEFSSAFETALGEAASTRVETETVENQGAQEVRPSADSQESSNDAATNEGARDNTEGDDPMESQNGSVPASSEVQQGEHQGDDTTNQNDDLERESSDGDRVASSLAAGLRLSPRSDASTTETQAPDGNATEQEQGEREVSEIDHTVEVNTTETEQAGAHPPTEQATTEQATTEQATEPTAEQATEQGTEPTAEQATEPSGDGAEPVDSSAGVGEEAGAASGGLVCPPDVDPDVFNSLPLEMQQDCVDQYNATRELAAQLDGSSLDPEVLAALPEEMRREVIEQDQRERRLREQQQEEAPADPAQAEEMDNASFLASLAPELREEILLMADDTTLRSLPPNIIAEAQILRERASQNRRVVDPTGENENGTGQAAEPARNGQQHLTDQNATNNINSASSSRKKARSGKLRVELERSELIYTPNFLSDIVSKTDLKTLIRLMFLLAPVRPPRLLQKVFQNICMKAGLRNAVSTVFINLLHEDRAGTVASIKALGDQGTDRDKDKDLAVQLRLANPSEFPPEGLLGSAPEIPEAETLNMTKSMSVQTKRAGSSLTVGAPDVRAEYTLPPVVAARLLDTIMVLCKNSPRFSLHALANPVFENGSLERTTCFEKLLELLEKPSFSKSASNLEQLLTLLEAAVSPLSYILKQGEEETEITQREIDAASATGKEWVDAPRIAVSQPRLQLLCSILRMETCRDTAFTKVNTIVRRLCRIESNRGYVLAELASVAQGLGADAIRDLRALKIRMDSAATQLQRHESEKSSASETGETTTSASGSAGHVSSSVTLSTSTSELKLLRVLQTLQALCGDNLDDAAGGSTKKNEGSIVVTEELVVLLRQMQFDELWDELASCLKVVQVLEGVKKFDDDDPKEGYDDNENDEMETNDDAASGEDNGNDVNGRKLRNSAAGLLTRFLPSIEAFFVANASATRSSDTKDTDPSSQAPEEIKVESLVGGKRVMEFVTTNKVILNALIRNNSGLLDKGLRALVQIPRCRIFLDFDVKRQWFKTQVRRLRQHASRRHGSLRLHIRRQFVFEDAYHQLRLRNADEMRGRLHITFRDEEGVDAGGLSREFFGILAKEIFNPNYALFTSTEDGCTFQPNPNSSINPDHLSYFRFVGRIVGKALADGFLLDAHFTRSLYKHMLGLQPTHHDMEAIDPDYYRNLKTILEYNLSDIGLELTFSTEDHSFGRNQVIDLIPNGRKVSVTEENKEEYVRLVCQHRMTTAIQSQIRAYLDGFYELISPELIAIFTPRELELLISGLPDIDVHDLKKNTEYVGWKATDKEIGWFWNIMFSLSRNEKAAFLQFVTGSSKVPLTGFSELQGMRGVQKFSIHKTGGTKGALMSAHTCFNSLDLPSSYQSEDEMREKLLYAINEGVGAFLFA